MIQRIQDLLRYTDPAPNGCRLVRQSGKNPYSNFLYRGRQISGHRLAWILTHGELPSGRICVCHRCDTPRCVNPEHLFIGTDLDNGRDKSAKGRSLRGERAAKAKLNADQVREIRRLRSTGMEYTAIGPMFGITPTNAHIICTGKSWKHIPFA